MRVFCIDWCEDDEACGAKEVGWTLHLSVEAAAAYIRKNPSPHYGHDGPFEVDIPLSVYLPLFLTNGLARKTPHDDFRTSPRECPYPRT